MVSQAFDTAGWPTRELILLHASRLFAGRGFLGTSTRDIASAVGIRQPSMYSHFPSKHAIAEELLRRDLHAGIEALQRCAQDPAGPAVQLYRYLLWEVTYVRETPFDLRALYLGELLDLPESSTRRCWQASSAAGSRRRSSSPPTSRSPSGRWMPSSWRPSAAPATAASIASSTNPTWQLRSSCAPCCAFRHDSHECRPPRTAPAAERLSP